MKMIVMIAMAVSIGCGAHGSAKDPGHGGSPAGFDFNGDFDEGRVWAQLSDGTYNLPTNPPQGWSVAPPNSWDVGVHDQYGVGENQTTPADPRAPGVPNDSALFFNACDNTCRLTPASRCDPASPDYAFIDPCLNSYTISSIPIPVSGGTSYTLAYYFKANPWYTFSPALVDLALDIRWNDGSTSMPLQASPAVVRDNNSPIPWTQMNVVVTVPAGATTGVVEIQAGKHNRNLYVDKVTLE